MAYAMTKQGSLDNCITYEFICDTVADMNAIENRYRSIGSVAIVLQGESDGLEVYIAGSDKNWNSLSSAGAGADSSTTGGLSIYICGQAEVDSQTGLPDIDEPDDKTIYLVPAGETSGNLYEEYIYVDDAWEQFGVGSGGSINLSNYIRKTDIATQSTAGLVKVLDNGNVTFNENNQLVLTLAGTAVVKTGQSDHPISVTHQHEAAFYGLAKAAGQDMKNSDNAVGTYTTEAASAIRTMIGAGTYSKPVNGIPANDLAADVIPDTSVYAPIANPEFTGTVSLDRVANSTVGEKSVALGRQVTASGDYSFAEGNYTTASGSGAHAEGQSTVASAYNAHAEGLQTKARGNYSHAEGKWDIGNQTTTYDNTTYYYGASGIASHSEGENTIAHGISSHAEGRETKAIGHYSHAEGYNNIVSGQNAHGEGNNVIVKGSNAHAEGQGDTLATHTLPNNTILTGSGAYGDYSHTEGRSTWSIGSGSHAEGYQTTTVGNQSHAEGYNTLAVGPSAHAEGEGNGTSTYNYRVYTNANPNQDLNGRTSTALTLTPGAHGSISHVEGYYTVASASYSHAEGYQTVASGGGSEHVEGYQTYAAGYCGEHAEGMYTYASGGGGGHAEGQYTMVSGAGGEHAEGQYTYATGMGAAHAEGYGTFASGQGAHAEGAKTTASDSQAHAEGRSTVASGEASHAEGIGGTFTINGVSYTSGATEDGAHSEGLQTLASNYYAHAEGRNTIASGAQSHAEGLTTEASGSSAHAEGSITKATGIYAHAEGYNTQAYGYAAHAEGGATIANGSASHAEGAGTVAEGSLSHVGGTYNIADNYDNLSEWTANTAYQIGDRVKKTTISNNNTSVSGYICKIANEDASFQSYKWTSLEGKMNYAEIIGNGTNNNTRSNARALDWDGNEHLMSDIYINCNPDSTGGTALGALVSGYESRISALEAEIESLRVALTALVIDTEVVLENGHPLTDEQGNLIEYDTPTT